MEAGLTLRFGLLGTGRWAAEAAAPGLVAVPDADLAAVWGRDPAKAAALADRPEHRQQQRQRVRARTPPPTSCSGTAPACPG